MDMHVSHETHDKHQGHSPALFKRKFLVCLALTVPAVLFSPSVQQWLGLQLGFAGIEYIPALFGSIIFLYGGLIFLRGAHAELSNRTPGMMTLISLAITVAFAYSLAVTLGVVQGMDFWWELATLVTIMLLGHWLEMASVQSAEGALSELAKLIPDTAERVTAEGAEVVPVRELRVNDRLLVRPGAKIPADGTIFEGDTDINESLLTGESKPISKHPGDVVIAGSINGSGAVTMVVTKIGNDTALAGIMRLVAEAQRSRSHTQILADKAAFYLTFVAIGSALATGVSWVVVGAQAGFILERVVTVLVIACPHALGLAVPLVTAISTTRAAKRGILVRQRMALETARTIDVVVFDKTGTLTTGEQGVVDIISPHTGVDKLLTQAAAVEMQSEHTIARAIVAAAKEKKLAIPEPTGFKAMAGRGAAATVVGAKTHVGGLQLLAELKLAVPDVIASAAKRANEDGKTVVYVVMGGEVIGAIALADTIRPESRQAVDDLLRIGKEVALLTGDSKPVASWVARQLGIQTFFAEVLPEHKADMVAALQKQGKRVAMVGDGVNDAPALTRADVGIAIGAGTDVAIESAGIVLAASDPRAIAVIIGLSHATYRKMMQNLAWAAGYNVVAIPLAAGVVAALGFVLSPAVGAVLMSLSTVIVAVNAQLLRRSSLTKG